MEAIGEQYAREFGLGVAVLRVGYILDGDRMLDKYGRAIKERAPLDTDRRDIGEVARRCLDREDRTLEVFHVMSTREAMREWGVEYTCRRLGWEPRFASLESIVRTAWDWHQARPSGYGDRRS
jgi:hypothetical protein